MRRPGRWRRSLSALSAATLIVALGGRARAQDELPSAAARALELRERGDALYNQARGGSSAAQTVRMGQALLAWRQSRSLRPDPGISQRIARALDALGRAPDAYAEYERYLDEATDLNDEQRAPFAARRDALRAQIHLLELDVSPTGTRVLVDGIDVGTSPLAGSIPLAPGLHVVEALALGREQRSALVDAAAGGESSISLELAPTRPPSIELHAEPRDASIELDGTRVDTELLGTPIPVTPGEHRVSLSREGYGPEERVVTANAGDALRLELTLRPVPAHLTLDIRPTNAAVLLDEERSLRADFAGEIPPGEHVLRIVASGHRETQRRLRIPPGESRRLAISLAPNPTIADEPLFWVGIGGAIAVVGVLVGVLAVALQPPPPNRIEVVVLP